MAVLFAVIGVFFTLKFRFGFIVGIYFMYYSLGQYQAFLPMAAALYLLALIRDVYELEAGKSAAAAVNGHSSEGKASEVSGNGGSKAGAIGRSERRAPPKSQLTFFHRRLVRSRSRTFSYRVSRRCS